MSANHNWSAKINQIMIDINKCSLSGPAAELFYIGKSCELMSAIIQMGTERLPRKSTDYDEIQRVLHYIDLHFKEDIKQADLVGIANMSPTKLKTLFRTFTGNSMTDYILNKKSDYAVHLLSETDMPVEEIGQEVGFTSLSGFSTSFKKRIGISPSAYRKQLQFLCLDNASYLDKISPTDHVKEA